MYSSAAMMMTQRLQNGMDQMQTPVPFTTVRLGTPVPPQIAATNRYQEMPIPSKALITSSGVLASDSQHMNEAKDKKPDDRKLEIMIHSPSAGSISTAASSRGLASGHESPSFSGGHASSCGSICDNPAPDSSKPRKPRYHWLPKSELDVTEGCLPLQLASNSAEMELQRTLRAQDQVRRWLSTAMSEKISCLEKELESQANLDSKNQKEKEVLDRQRSQAQVTRVQNMEKRHKRQHDVYEEAQRIVVEKQQQALEKVQRWDEQVHAVLDNREHNHQIRKDIQQVASRALESFNDKIHRQRVQSKINTEELRDHMAHCLSHKLFDPVAMEHSKEKVSATRALRSCRSEQALHSPRCQHAAHNLPEGANSPKYRYRPISALVAAAYPSLSDHCTEELLD